jgi:uncharacterized protein
MNTRPTALVTGASGGIGEALARELAAGGHDLVLVARSVDRLDALASELRTKHGVETVTIGADLAVPGAGHALAHELAARNIIVDVLINNAGFADYGEFWKAPADKLDQMMVLNMTTLAELMRDLLPSMVERKRGRVMNVASIAAFMPGPLMATYYATKAFVLSLSEATHEELKGTGVTVTALCPGPTESGFATAAAVGESKLFKDRKLMDTTTVASLGVKAMMAGKPVLVTGTKNKFQAITPKLTPRRLIPGFVMRAQARSH